jgi:hypothetical protein
VPAVLVLDLGEPAALDGPGQHDCRLAAAAIGGRAERLVDGGEVVPVDLDHSCAECRGPAVIGAQVPLQLSGAALAQPVHVDDRGEV